MKGMHCRGRGSIGSKADDIVGPFLVPEDDAGQSSETRLFPSEQHFENSLC